MSLIAIVGTSTDPDPFKAGREASLNAKSKLEGNSIKLIFLFSSIEYANDNMLKGIRDVFPGVDIIGSSGAGTITPSGIMRKAVVLMLIASDDVDFISHLEYVPARYSHESAEQLSNELISKTKNAPRNVLILLADSKIKNVSSLLSGIKEKFGISFPVVGGFASDNFSFSNTYIYFKDKVYTNSIAGLLLSSKNIKFGIGIKHGWKPLGKLHKVTKCEGNIIKEIDQRPAISLYEEYFDEAKKELGDMPLSKIAILYPLGLYLDAEKEYILRNVIELTNDGSLICQADVPEGVTIRLMMGTRDACLNASSHALWEAKEVVRKFSPRFAIIFSSASRLKLFGRNLQEEFDFIKQNLNGIPFIGTYTYAEIAPLRALDYAGESCLHNESFTVILFAQ